MTHAWQPVLLVLLAEPVIHSIQNLALNIAARSLTLQSNTSRA